jgi:outer membrane lipoprotein-sorting protein
MCKGILLFLLIIKLCVCQAQHPGYNLLVNANAFKDQFAVASGKINTLESNFVQEKNLSMLAEKIVSKGKFWFKKDSRLRMEYNDPFQYLLILNSDKLYIKDGQRENKISTRSNQLFRQINSLMMDCVKGTALASPDFSVRIFENAATDLIELSPLTKNLKEFFKNINIIVDKKDDSVEAIEMYEISGDSTVIHFINRELNTTIPDALFTIH